MLPSKQLRQVIDLVPGLSDIGGAGVRNEATQQMRRLAGNRMLSVSPHRLASAITSWTFASFDERAKGVAGLDFTAKRDNPLTAQEELEELPSGHWVAARLKSPNPYMDWQQMRRLAMLLLDTTGDAFIWTPTLGDAVPQTMILMPSAGVQLIPGAHEGEPLLKEYRFQGQGGSLTVPEREVCHLRHAWVWPDVFRMMFKGRSLLDAIADAVQVDRETMTYLRALFENGMTAAFGLKIEGEMGPEQFDQFINRAEETFGGSRNAGKMIVMERGMEYVPFTSTGREKELSEIDAGNRRRLCAVTGVPESVLTSEHQNRASSETVEASFQRRTISNLGNLFANGLGAHFSRFERGIQIEIGKYVSGDPADLRADEMHLVGIGLPPNVVLARRGEQPVEGGDTPRYLSNLVTDAQAAAQAQQAAMAASGIPASTTPAQGAPSLFDFPATAPAAGNAGQDALFQMALRALHQPTNGEPINGHG